MRILTLAVSAALLVQSGLACADTPSPAIKALAHDVKVEALRANIVKLVGFGTRHTLSDTTSDVRGIGAARRWVKAEFDDLAKACQGCITVETPENTVSGDRLPAPVLIQDVLAIQRGTTDPDRVIIISGHIDSRVSDVMNSVSDAPGANDDGSGTAAVLEAARVLSRQKFPATIVYAITSGEEQGLYGAKLLAAFALSKGWRVEAVLNNDIIGNSHGEDGQVVDTIVRVFSAGTKEPETQAQSVARKRSGGELDSPSRNLSRFMFEIASQYLPELHVRQIMRADRFGRGGDQGPMQEAGFPAIRLTEADENYQRQHQDLRTEGQTAYGDVIEGIDFPYLAKITRLNVVAMAVLAAAPPPPYDVKITGAVSPDTTVTWAAVPSAAGYRVWWRETTDPRWTFSRDAGSSTQLTLKGINIDDYSFGVSSLSVDGFASPIEFPGIPGAFMTRPAPAN